MQNSEAPPSGPATTAEQILDVSEAMIQRRGYNAVSYGDLAAELDLTTAAIHYHFPSKDDRLRSLVRATRRILGKRGWLSDADEAEFSDLDLDRPELYEIIGLVGIKTMSNYVNHIVGTDVDDVFQQ